MYAEKVEELTIENAKLKSELIMYKRHIFGRKSERFFSSGATLPGQEFFDPELFGFSVPHVAAPTSSPSPEPADKKGKPVRKPLGESRFEVITEDLYPQEDISQLKYIGVEVSTHQVLVDAKIVIKKIRRYKYLNTATGEITIADMPYRPFAKSTVSSSIVSEVLVQKYVDAMPLNRQQQSWRRLGIDFPYSSLTDMPRMAYKLIEPLFQEFKNAIIEQSYLQVDESPIKVLSREKKKSTHLGYYYVAHDPVNKCVLYDYNKHKNYKQTSEFLEKFNGKVLQSDGYEGYDAFIKGKPDIVHIYCMAHARRYFERALDNDAERAKYFLEEVRKLYQIERVIKEKEIRGDDKVQYRREHATPILLRLKVWLYEQIHRVAPRSSIGKAIAYSRERWDGLMAYCDLDFAEIDTNPIERNIRPMVIGRKNYLFAGSHESAQRAACFYSFFITCRLHGVNPKEWIEYVFENIEHTKPSQYHTLFPQNWRRNQQQD